MRPRVVKTRGVPSPARGRPPHPILPRPSRRTRSTRRARWLPPPPPSGWGASPTCPARCAAAATSSPSSQRGSSRQKSRGRRRRCVGLEAGGGGAAPSRRLWLLCTPPRVRVHPHFTPTPLPQTKLPFCAWVLLACAWEGCGVCVGSCRCHRHRALGFAVPHLTLHIPPPPPPQCSRWVCLSRSRRQSRSRSSTAGSERMGWRGGKGG